MQWTAGKIPKHDMFLMHISVTQATLWFSRIPDSSCALKGQTSKYKSLQLVLSFSFAIIRIDYFLWLLSHVGILFPLHLFSSTGIITWATVSFPHHTPSLSTPCLLALLPWWNRFSRHVSDFTVVIFHFSTRSERRSGPQFFVVVWDKTTRQWEGDEEGSSN